MKGKIDIHKGIINTAQQNKYRCQEKTQLQKKQIAREKIQNFTSPLFGYGYWIKYHFFQATI